MIRNLALALGSSLGRHYVAKRRDVAPTIAYLHARQHWLAKDPPRFVTAARHRADFGKLCLSILWLVATAQRSDEANQLAAKFQTTLDHCAEYELRNECIRREEDV